MIIYWRYCNVKLRPQTPSRPACLFPSPFQQVLCKLPHVESRMSRVQGSGRCKLDACLASDFGLSCTLEEASSVAVAAAAASICVEDRLKWQVAGGEQRVLQLIEHHVQCYGISPFA